MLIAGILLNNILFVINGMLLFRLALFLNGGNMKEAILAVYIHCWCPASIFYSSLYSESIYSTFTFIGLILLYSPTTFPSRHNLLVASAVFSFAFLTRSNGLTNIGFIAFPLLLDSFIFIGRQLPNENGGKHELQRYQQLEFREWSFNLVKRFLTNFLFGLICFAFNVYPLRVFEFSVHDKFCTLFGGQYINLHIKNYLNSEVALSREIVLPGELTKLYWCNESFSLSNNFLLPNYYQFIQQKYWDVGLFTYWKWQKFPLFLIAAPTLWLAIYGFIKQTFQLLSTDLRPIPEILIDRNSQIPFACHILLLALSGIFFYNVEVSIRLLYSSSPFLYLVLARIINNQTIEQQKIDDLMHSNILPFLRGYMRKGFWPFLIFCYLFGYFIFGTMLHVNW
ncbi:GPI mannosyltransferase 2, partial [Meloidogyne graminicola]